jgi:hypothetical protein
VAAWRSRRRGREVKSPEPKMGVIRLTERRIPSHHPPGERRWCSSASRWTTSGCRREGVRPTIGTSGTILSLGTATALERRGSRGGAEPARRGQEPAAPPPDGEGPHARRAAGAPRARPPPRRLGRGWRRAADTLSAARANEITLCDLSSAKS